MKKTGMEKVDRISQLPEIVLHYILSFLPYKQVVQMSVLSKTWEEAWRTFRIFEIDRSILDRIWYDRKEFREKRMKILNRLEQTLRNRLCKYVVPIDDFKINLGLYKDPEFASFVDRCICYAIGSEVKRMELQFDNIDDRWCLPPIVLCAKSIEVLRLKGCKLELPRRNIVKLSCLRKLCLFKVVFKGHIISSLLASCPLIEEMSIDSCQGMETIDLFAHERLNDIKIFNNWDLRRVDIRKLNVSSLTIVVNPRMENLFEINMASCTNIKNVAFESLPVSKEWLSNLISELPLLECLELVCCNELNSLKILNPSIKKLRIRTCRRVVEVLIEAPNLSQFSFDGERISLCSNALALSSIDLHLQDWNVEFANLLAQFHNFSGTLNLGFRHVGALFVIKKLRETPPSPLFSCKHLNLWIERIYSLSSFSTAKLVDDLLWIAPHTRNISIGYNIAIALYRKTSFEISYKKQLVSEGHTSCCQCSPVLCWQHCIEEVKVEIYDDQKRDTKRYSLKGAKFFDTIDALCGRILP